MNPGMDELEQVIGKLSSAALQLAPSDDQIIAGHIRDSVALLLQARHKMLEASRQGPHSSTLGTER